ncbi:MAG: lysophospholipid acyltransferase family protein [Candidatus Gastranaerophilaceae bacterium]
MIRFMRSCFALFTYILFALGAMVIGFIIFPLLRIFSNNPKKEASKIIYKSWHFLILYLTFFKIIKINYPKELTEIKNKVIVASHPSYIDIVILIGLIPNSICLAKKNILKNPIMKNIVKMLYITNDTDIDNFKIQSKEVLDSGFNIIIFPAGHRTKNEENIHIHKGAALLAIENNIPIIPIQINVHPSFLQKESCLLDLGDKTAVFDIEMKSEIIPNKVKTDGITEILLRKKICELIKENI